MIFLLLYTHFSRKESFLCKIYINYHVYTALTQLCSPSVIRKSVSGTQKMILGWQPLCTLYSAVLSVLCTLYSVRRKIYLPSKSPAKSTRGTERKKTNSTDQTSINNRFF